MHHEYVNLNCYPVSDNTQATALPMEEFRTLRAAEIMRLGFLALTALTALATFIGK